jgi:hypothetical protein
VCDRSGRIGCLNGYEHQLKRLKKTFMPTVVTIELSMGKRA